MTAVFSQAYSGYSLFELLIASALSLFLMSGLTIIYVNMLSNAQFQQALIQIQDNGRTLSSLLANDLRMSGFIGCGRLSEIPMSQHINAIAFAPESRLVVYHQGKSSANYSNSKLSSILQESEPASDILVIQYLDPHTTPALSKDNSIVMQAKADFASNDVLLIADCQHADIFHVAESTSRSVIPEEKLTQRYSAAITQVGLFHSYVFYIANTGRKNLSGLPIYALFRRDLNGPTKQQTELLEGVRKMRIYLGVQNEDQGNITYYSGDRILDWRKITTVHILLLLESIEAVNHKPQSYWFDDSLITPVDRCLYKQWDIYVNLRESNL